MPVSSLLMKVEVVVVFATLMDFWIVSGNYLAGSHLYEDGAEGI